MDNSLVQKIQTILNEELIRRLLRKYFTTKGLGENMDRSLYPPILQDLTRLVPQLNGKVEVVPTVAEIDPNGGDVKVEWNLFVLGTHRMSLGESTHRNLAELNQAAFQPKTDTVSSKKASPKQIVEFIGRVMGSSKAGIISKKKAQIVPSNQQVGSQPTSFGGSRGFEQNKPVL
jgi:hypothetical protein